MNLQGCTPWALRGPLYKSALGSLIRVRRSRITSGDIYGREFCERYLRVFFYTTTKTIFANLYSKEDYIVLFYLFPSRLFWCYKLLETFFFKKSGSCNVNKRIRPITIRTSSREEEVGGGHLLVSCVPVREQDCKTDSPHHNSHIQPGGGGVHLLVSCVPVPEQDEGPR